MILKKLKCQSDLIGRILIESYPLSFSFIPQGKSILGTGFLARHLT